ncbi:killer cell lectin-like receptor subfamily B member 1F-like protein, partial [Cricetulus griseus]
CLPVPTLASVGSETQLCWADPSFLEPDWPQCLRVQIMGTNEENSCAVISQTEVFSDFCSADNRWICQKKLKYV